MIEQSSTLLPRNFALILLADIKSSNSSWSFNLEKLTAVFLSILDTEPEFICSDKIIVYYLIVVGQLSIIITIQDIDAEKETIKKEMASNSIYI